MKVRLQIYFNRIELVHKMKYEMPGKERKSKFLEKEFSSASE